MQDFRNIRAWQRAHALVLRVYAFTKDFPPDELYGLISQTRRAAVSIPANIAEGAGRGGRREFPRYLDVSFGSACELEYYVLLAYDLKLLAASEYEVLSAELGDIKRMIAALARAIRGGHRSKPKTDN